MSDYEDKSYYEIQLEQKQLVLILLLMVAICVLFFFLGVYYVKARNPTPVAEGGKQEEQQTGLRAPEGPDQVEAEQVSRFFETGGGRESSPKDQAEGEGVVA